MAWFNFSAPFKNALAGACMLAASTSGSYAYSAYYVFGDSLSDVGNLYALDDKKLPGAPYDNGRFSNGQVWAEDVARDLGLGPLTPSYKGGNDYAVATATASKAVPSSNPITPLLVPTIRQQVSLFGLQHREKADPAALYSVWIGANDVINALIAIEQNKLTADKAEMELATSAQAEVTAIARLVGYGARNLLVGLVPDLGLIPRFNTTDARSRLATTLSAYYNTQLQDDAGAAIPAGDLTYFDTFELLDEAKADPAKFGLTNVTNNCYSGPFTGGGSVCANPDKYLFWDQLHPTAAGHQVIAEMALEAFSAGPVSAVPLPASAPLFGGALLALSAIGYGLKRRGAATAWSPQERLRISRRSSGDDRLGRSAA